MIFFFAFIYLNLLYIFLHSQNTHGTWPSSRPVVMGTWPSLAPAPQRVQHLQETLPPDAWRQPIMVGTDTFDSTSAAVLPLVSLYFLLRKQMLFRYNYKRLCIRLFITLEQKLKPKV